MLSSGVQEKRTSQKCNVALVKVTVSAHCYSFLKLVVTQAPGSISNRASLLTFFCCFFFNKSFVVVVVVVSVRTEKSCAQHLWQCQTIVSQLEQKKIYYWAVVALLQRPEISVAQLMAHKVGSCPSRPLLNPLEQVRCQSLLLRSSLICILNRNTRYNASLNFCYRSI